MKGNAASIKIRPLNWIAAMRRHPQKSDSPWYREAVSLSVVIFAARVIILGEKNNFSRSSCPFSFFFFFLDPGQPPFSRRCRKPLETQASPPGSHLITMEKLLRRNLTNKSCSPPSPFSLPFALSLFLPLSRFRVYETATKP